MNNQERIEQLGPAEKILQALMTFTDHFVHNRTGLVTKDPHSPTGVKWEPVIYKNEGGEKVVYRRQRIGKKGQMVRLGTMNGSNTVKNGRTVVGEFRAAGLFPENIAYCYRKAAEVWQMDNEFAARWASWAQARDHRDMKVMLAALMLVQKRCGEPIMEDGKVLFNDEDYRNVGEAMCLAISQNAPKKAVQKGKKAEKEKSLDFNAKMLLRVGELLKLPEVAQVNREFGFGQGGKNAFLGRYPKVVEKWLEYRQNNPPLLEGQVKAGMKELVKELARSIHYDGSAAFYEALRWQQVQAKDGRRKVAVGKKVKKAETWEGKTELQICELIAKDKPSWKIISSRIPKDVGMTKAIVACAVESGCMSDQDLIIMTPTLELLGLLTDPAVQKVWKKAIDNANDQRATNIARNVKTKAAKDALQDATDKATAKALDEATKDLRVYVVIDKSGSMQQSLGRAQEYLTKFLGGFPLDRLHVSVFNTVGTELTIRMPKAAAVRQAFAGHTANGGTDYTEGLRVLVDRHKPKDGEDALVIFVGDEADSNRLEGHRRLEEYIRASKLNPVAFGLLKVAGEQGNIVTDVAARLGIPCFPVDERMFTSEDPYAITRMMHDLIKATPVGKRTAAAPLAQRKSLVQEILDTKMLEKPVWA